MVKGNDFDNTIEMKIDTIITPAERIRMYRDKFTVLGSSDIALVKTSKPILFTPNQVTPVQLKCYIDFESFSKTFSLKICLNKVREEGQDAFVTGFGYAGDVDTEAERVFCWTDEAGPSRFST